MPDPVSQTTISIRIKHRDPQSDLHGYVFTDTSHARRWLMTRSLVYCANITLEKVEVGENRQCPRCRGAGFTQSVTPVGKMTVDEFLNGKADA